MFLSKDEALKIMVEFFIDIAKQHPLVKTPTLAAASQMFPKQFLIDLSMLILNEYKRSKDEVRELPGTRARPDLD